MVESHAQHCGTKIESTAYQAGRTLKHGAQKARDTIQDLNRDGTVTDVLTAVTVVGAGVLVAKGTASLSNGGGGCGGSGTPGLVGTCGAAAAAVLATGGATYLAHQAVKERSSRRYSTSLNEDLHME